MNRPSLSIHSHTSLALESKTIHKQGNLTVSARSNAPSRKHAQFTAAALRSCQCDGRREKRSWKKSGNHFSPRDDDDDVPSVDQSSLQAKSRAVESCGRARFVVFSRNISRAVVPSRDFPRVWVRRFRREWPYPGSLFSRNFPTRSPRVVPQRVSVLKKEEREKKYVAPTFRILRRKEEFRMF